LKKEVSNDLESIFKKGNLTPQSSFNHEIEIGTLKVLDGNIASTT